MTEEFDMDAELARMRAQTDQLEGTFGELARGLGAFYSHLRNNGFDPGTAFVLTRDWFLHMLHGGNGQ